MTVRTAIKHLKNMPPELLPMMAQLMTGKAALIVVNGEMYALSREDPFWLFRACDGSGVSFACEDGSCTCADHKFRQRECKHVKALRRLLGVESADDDEGSVPQAARGSE